MASDKTARIFRTPNPAALHDGSWVRIETWRQVDLPDSGRDLAYDLVKKWKREGRAIRSARLSAALELHLLGDLRACMRAETLNREHDAAAAQKIERLIASRAKARAVLEGDA